MEIYRSFIPLNEFECHQEDKGSKQGFHNGMKKNMTDINMPNDNAKVQDCTCRKVCRSWTRAAGVPSLHGEYVGAVDEYHNSGI